MNLRFLCSFFFLFSATCLLAQERTITGKVTTQTETPVSGASVSVKGTTTGTTTNAQGEFSLSVPVSATTIVISSIGYTNQEVPVKDLSTVSVVLSNTQQSLNEVVVVAYGTQRREAVTSSIAQVSAKQLENRPVTNVLSSLAGVAPGLTTSSTNGQPGSSPVVRIRGFGSLSSSNTPLYVVDGVPYDYDISNINPDDIDNIAIMKDAAASALYGSRAANGVIQITTKRGRKDRTQITANLSQGFISRGIPEYEMVNAYQYYPLMWEAYRNSLVYPTSGAALPVDSANKVATGLYPRNTAGNQVYPVGNRIFSDIRQLLGYNPFNVPNTQIVGVDGQLNPNATLLYPDDLDWLSNIQRNGIRGDYTLSLSGGAPKSDYYLSLGYTNDKGYVQNSDYERFSARLNVNSQPLNWLKAGLNLAGIVTEANQGASDASTSGLVNPFYISRIIAPIYPVYVHDPVTGNFVLDAAGNKQYDLGNLGSLGGNYLNRPVSTGRHAVYETILNENILKRNVLNSRIYGEITFLKNFRLTGNATADISNSLRARFDNPIVGDGAPSGRANRNTTSNLTMTINQLLNYSRNFGDHTVEALAGHETFSGRYFVLNNQRTGQVLQGNTELANFTTTTQLTSYTDREKIESYLSRVNYNFKNKYFLSGSLRRDGSSRFAPDYRWGTFWSLGAAWSMDKESFFNNLDWVNSLRLRASYGTVGNQDILAGDPPTSNYFAYQAFYNLGNNNNTEPGAAQSTIGGNPTLQWEVNTQFDVALEFGLFKNRLNGTFEVFDRRSSNLLFSVTPPVSSGYLGINQNVGSMYNKGIEISLNGDLVRTKDVTWNLGTNFTAFKNKITKMPANLPEVITSIHKWQVGVSRYEFWTREYMGVDPADGMALYRANSWVPSTSRIDSKGDTLTIDQNNARFHHAGSSIPDFYGAILTSLAYKGFSLSMQLNYSVGGLFYDDVYRQLMHAGNYGTSLHKDAINRWQATGQVTEVPRLDAGRTAAFTAASDRWLTDATYFNIQNAILSYTLPKALITRAKLQQVRIYVGGENLYLFTKRKGMNPSQTFTGLNTNVYTPSRTITAGVNLSL